VDREPQRCIYGEHRVNSPSSQRKLPERTEALSIANSGDQTRTMQKSNSVFPMSNRTPRLAVGILHKIESRLNRSFYAAVSAWVICIVISGVFGPILLAPHGNRIPLALMIMVLFLLALAGYVWYVVSIYATAKAIHKPNGVYLAWAILGPLLSQLPIPIPFISTALAVTPLIVKFILSNELRAMIRLQTLRDLH
jgi:hypothetical protein